MIKKYFEFIKNTFDVLQIPASSHSPSNTILPFTSLIRLVSLSRLLC